MVNTTTRIKDSGTNLAGEQIYDATENGDWIDILGGQLLFEGNVNESGHVNYQTNPNNSSVLEHSSNEITMLQPPRITLRGTIKDATAFKIATLWNLRKTKGVKRLAGGLGVIDAIYDGIDTHKYLNVIITNVTFSENYSNDMLNVSYTIQMKQV